MVCCSDKPAAVKLDGDQQTHSHSGGPEADGQQQHIHLHISCRGRWYSRLRIDLLGFPDTAQLLSLILY